MNIYIENGQFGWDYKLVGVDNDGNERSILIQTDYDYPGIASSFGWVPCDQCHDTDGTVDCTHKTASDMICDASKFLDSISDTGYCVDDPGYFE